MNVIILFLSLITYSRFTLYVFVVDALKPVRNVNGLCLIEPFSYD